MSYRLQVLIPKELDARLRKAAQRGRVSKGEWVRRAVETALTGHRKSGAGNPVAQLGSLGAPTGSVKRMLAEIEAGRS